MGLTRECVIGLDLGAERISVAQVNPRGNAKPRLVNAGSVSITPGLDVEDVGAAIRDLWKRCHLSCYTVASCLRSNSTVIRHFRFPSLNDQELTAALMLEAEEVLQLDSDEIVMDWHESRMAAAPSDRRGREGVLVAAAADDVARHRAILDAAGLFPIVVDVGCTAMSNAFMALRGIECQTHAVCVVNLLGNTADAAILYDDTRMYPRCITDLSEGEKGVRRLTESLNDVLKYFEFKLRHEAVTDIVITGIAPDIDALCRRVQERLALPVSVWNCCKDMQVTNARVARMLEARPETGRELAAAIGMAMRR